MFSNLSEKLTKTIRNLTGRGRITEENIRDTLREIRVALLEADVSLPVVKQLIIDISQRAIGQDVIGNLRPGDSLIKIVKDELIKIMGETHQEIDLNTEPPAVILTAGLQGSGKTTTVAKLAHLLKENKKKSVLIASTDIYRPAAIEQLKVLAKHIEVEFFASNHFQNPVKIAENAILDAKKKFIDVVIIDTAGRLHIDQEMMTEICNIHATIKPIETIFIIDSMTGQDAANTAKAFNDALPLTGIILTKVDGDARGGAALSVKMITGKPIKYIGVGEKLTAIEPFHPERIVSQILGMGDILTLVEDATKKIDQQKAKKLAKKISKGKTFNLADFKEQLLQLKNMGGITNLLDKLPLGMVPRGGSLAKVKNMVDDKIIRKMEAIINSMTAQERYFPAIIKGSRKRRIAAGSGTQVQDINRLLKQFMQMQKMLKKFKGSKMLKMFGKLK